MCVKPSAPEEQAARAARNSDGVCSALLQSAKPDVGLGTAGSFLRKFCTRDNMLQCGLLTGMLNGDQWARDAIEKGGVGGGVDDKLGKGSANEVKSKNSVGVAGAALVSKKENSKIGGATQSKRCLGLMHWVEYAAFFESRDVEKNSDEMLKPCLFGSPMYEKLAALQREVLLGVGGNGDKKDIGDLRARWARLTSGTDKEEDESAAFHADDGL